MTDEPKPEGWRNKHPILNMAISKLDAIEQQGVKLEVLETNLQVLEERVKKIEQLVKGKKKKAMKADVNSKD